jgi:hypothetical protein
MDLDLRPIRKEKYEHQGEMWDRKSNDAAIGRRARERERPSVRRGGGGLFRRLHTRSDHHVRTWLTEGTIDECAASASS